MEEEIKLKKEKALLVGFYSHGSDRPICDEHLEELKLLREKHVCIKALACTL